jgi:hypothetical protein
MKDTDEVRELDLLSKSSVKLVSPHALTRPTIPFAKDSYLLPWPDHKN